LHNCFVSQRFLLCGPPRCATETWRADTVSG
jgi:hypothetical protein